MRTIKVLAIIGLAVALAGVPVLAAGATAGGVGIAGLGGANVNVFATIGAPAPAANWANCGLAAAAAPPPGPVPAPNPFVAQQQCVVGVPAGPFASSALRAGWNPPGNPQPGLPLGLFILGNAVAIGDDGELKVTVSWKDVRDVKKGETITVTVDRDFVLKARAEAKVVLLKGDTEISDEVKVTGPGEIKLTIKDSATANELKLRLTMNVGVVPTLTEWGLIALAVLLAGGMGYMIYRRRPALRPAAP